METNEMLSSMITDNVTNDMYKLSIENLQLDDVYVLGTLIATDVHNPDNKKETSFEYNTDVGDLLLHSYSKPGWITGSSYEIPADEIFTDYNNVRIVADFIEISSENFKDKMAIA